jgi:predicted component of type VI protein secretion system
MIQLHILSGKKAGSLAVASHFPFRIGRAPENDLSLEDAGIWEQHVTLEFKKREGFHLATASNALAAVNDKPVENILLRNGDVITLGSAKIQFWLAPAPQRGLRLRENFIWALLILVTAGQFCLLYFLMQ